MLFHVAKLTLRSRCSRQICTFFLGWVFITSISCLLSSSLVQGLLWKCRTVLIPSTPADERSSRFDVESIHFEKTPSLMTKNTDVILKGDSPSLFFILSLCFTFASLAHFASLLTFTPNGGETACGMSCDHILEFYSLGV